MCVEGQRLVEAGRLLKGVSAPITGAGHLAVPTADPIAGGGRSEDSRAEGEEGASSVRAIEPLILYIS